MAFSGSQNTNRYAGINLYTPDFQLISTALTAKQQKLDTNRAKLQSYRDQLGLSLDVAKDADQKYIDDRLSQLTAMTNEYASMDLSNDGLTQSLIGNLGQVVDGNVKNAVASTKVLQSEQAEWADKRKNKPELYSEDNYRFAMQKANNWMNDNTVGTAYNGGGGFIEYVDVNAKLMKALPDLMKSFTEEQVRQVSSGQPIGSVIKTQSINKNKMSAAIEGLLGEKERKQLQINAWSTYDGVPDEQLATEYNSFIDDKADVLEEKIKAAQSLIATSSGANKEAYKRELDFLKEEKGELDNMSFDSVVAQGGKTAVYNQLYQTKFKNQFLEAFTFNDRIIDIDVDATAKANLEYAFDLEKFNETKRHNLAMEAKTTSKSKSGSGVGDYAYMFPNGAITETAEKTTIDTTQARKNKADKESYVETKSRDRMFNGLVSITKDEDRAAEIMADPNFRQYLYRGDFSKAYVDEKGTAVKLPVSVLQDYQETYVKVPKVKKEAFKTINKTIKDAQAALLRGIATDNASWDEIPKSSYRLQPVNGDPEKFKLVKDKDGNRYKNLLEKRRKGVLTEADKKELNLLSSLHLLSDPKLREVDRNLIRQKISNENLKGVNYSKEVKELYKEMYKKEGDTVPGFKSKKDLFKDIHFSDFTLGDVVTTDSDITKWKTTSEEEKKYQNLSKIIAGEYEERRQSSMPSLSWDKKIIRTIPSKRYTDEELSVMKKEAAKLQNKVGNIGVDTILKRQFDRIHREVDGYYNTNLPSGKVFKISKDLDKDYHKAVTLKLGFEDLTADVKFEHLFDKNGNPTNQVKFYQDKITYNKKGGQTTPQIMRIGERTVTVDFANRELNMTIDYTMGKRYDARTPKTARTITLGNGKRSSADKLVPFSTNHGQLQEQLYSRLDKSYGKDISNVAISEVEKYRSGVYTIKYEVDPETRQYYAFAYKGGKKEFDGAGIPVGDKFDETTVEGWMRNPTESSRKATDSFLAILDQYIDYYANKKYHEL